MSARVTDVTRKTLEASILAALTLIYQGKAQAVREQLGALASEEAELPPEVMDRLAQMARERAEKARTGINRRLEQAEQAAADPSFSGDPALAVNQAQYEIEHYNRTVLVPFLYSFAVHQAQKDVYSATPDPDGSGQSALEATQWIWTQATDFEDDCTEAADASPASYDELVSIAGSEPPAHPRCQCSLAPAL